MVLTLTVVPALCLLFVRNEAPRRSETPIVRWLQSIYEPALGHTIRRGRWAMVAVGALTVIGLAMLPSLSSSPMPAFKELSVLINLKAVPGTSQPEMSRISGRMADELRKVDGVRNVGAHIGRAILGDQIVDVNSAELWVSIDPKANYSQTAKKIKSIVEGYPGLSYNVQTYLRKKSGDVVQEPEDTVVVRVFGDKSDVLGTTAAEVKNAISGIKGIEKADV